MKIDDIVIGEEYATKYGRRCKALAIEKVVGSKINYTAPRRLVLVRWFDTKKQDDSHVEARFLASTYAAHVEKVERREAQRLENQRDEAASAEELERFIPLLTAVIGVDLFANTTPYAGRNTISFSFPRDAVRKLREALEDHASEWEGTGR